MFHARKLSFKKMLIAIWFSANSVKGKAALQLSREIGVQYKTAWVLLMKLREAIAWRREEMVLDGEARLTASTLAATSVLKTRPRIASSQSAATSRPTRPAYASTRTLHSFEAPFSPEPG
ncbi:transposase (plasmid) [Rhizobium grahamii CCGE 502]|uniref:Transposase n=1 Tax=Rhizobium grahamii CCGE 502 TaxID=990285 RepID=S3I3W3_9HYPH|nr:transposase [Rhizobium grahamii CCGE 502]